ncbi:Ig-like domain-containing protein [Sphingobium algorifonticola]|nr:Ig-like domain-containing protein [Sphingobium algorifonticola]
MTSLDVLPTAAAELSLAGDDGPFFTTFETRFVLPRNVLIANDIDPAGGVGNITSVQDAVGGTAVLDANTNNVFFTPAPGFSGQASFAYTIVYTDGTADTATVSIEVGGPPEPDNGAPTGQDFFEFFMQEGGVLVVSGPGVLDGASDPDGDALSVILTQDAGFGDLFLNPDGSFSFRPFQEYSEDVFFNFRVTDGNLASDEYSAIINIQPVNDAPNAGDDFYELDADTVFSGSVLENDGDLEDDGLQAILVSGVANGTLEFAADGSFTYTPNAGFSGTDSFTYRASDGLDESEIATVTLTVTPAEEDATISGTSADDQLKDTSGDDVIDGGAGDDRIFGGEGNDVIRGGAGEDWVDYSTYRTGGVRIDLALLGEQDTGAAGRDRIGGIENIHGSRVDDVLRGDSGSNQIKGGTGNDLLFGAGGVDYLFGDAGDDILDGGTGADVIAGGGGIDRFVFTSADGDLVKDWQAGEVVDISAIGGAFALVSRYGKTFVTFDTDGDGQFDDGSIIFNATLARSDFYTGDAPVV